MSKTDTWENELLLLLFNNTATSLNIGDSSGLQPSGTAGSLYVALGASGMSSETFDPTFECNQSSGGTYTNYARIAVARSAAGWTVSGNQADNNTAVTFAASVSADSVTIADFAICAESTAGVNDALYHGTLTASLAISGAGTTPEFTNDGDLTITED